MKIRSIATITLLVCAGAAPVLAQPDLAQTDQGYPPPQGYSPPPSYPPPQGYAPVQQGYPPPQQAYPPAQQRYAAPAEATSNQPVLFVEVFGNWGVNFGQTPFVPDDRPGASKYPFASGFGGGAAVGITVLPPWLSLFVDWRYGSASTISGHLNGALTNAHGEISYHAFTLGLRMERHAGIGSVYAQFAGGALLPFHTTIELTYDPALAQIGITGQGKERDDYGAAYGAEAEMGYHFDLPERFYVGAGIRLAAFQATNNGHDTTFTNFVTDFTAAPPVAVDATIHHNTINAATPTTYSVQDIKLSVSVGYRF
jgi:hypothetical protein